MSVSTDSEQAYNEFYHNAELSDGQSEGFIDRTVVKQAPAKGRAAAIQPGTGSVLSGLLAPFEICCVIRSPAETNGTQRRPPVRDNTGDASPMSEFIMQTSEFHEYSNDGGSSETSSEEDSVVAIGAAPGIYKPSRRKGPDGAGAVGRLGAEELAVIKSRLETFSVKWKNVVSSSKLDDSARWIVAISLSEAIDLGIMELSKTQKHLMMLYWSMSVTLSAKMTAKLMQKCVEVARWEMPTDMSIDQALSKRDEFGTLELSSTIETRIIEEIMGEFEQKAAEKDPSPNFLIISKARAVGVSARKQGDASLVTVFDGGISRERGPAFLGFDRVEAAEKFLIALYSDDPLVNQSSERFVAWIVKNKHGAHIQSDLRAKGVTGEAAADVRPAWDSEARDQDDSQAQAKIAYTAMYKATDAPMEKERVFTQSAAGAIHVKDRVN